MKQQDMFEAAIEPMHFGPEPSPGLPNWKRIAVCGQLYALAERDPTIRALGSSNIKFVTCPRCLDIVEARKKISEAGE